MKAALKMDGYGGRYSQPVEVIGETPKRYRIRADYGNVRLAGRRRCLAPGEAALVPKHAIELSGTHLAEAPDVKRQNPQETATTGRQGLRR